MPERKRLSGARRGLIVFLLGIVSGHPNAQEIAKGGPKPVPAPATAEDQRLLRYVVPG
jgi:hypothetical protein